MGMVGKLKKDRQVALKPGRKLRFIKLLMKAENRKLRKYEKRNVIRALRGKNHE